MIDSCFALPTVSPEVNLACLARVTALFGGNWRKEADLSSQATRFRISLKDKSFEYATGFRRISIRCLVGSVLHDPAPGVSAWYDATPQGKLRQIRHYETGKIRDFEDGTPGCLVFDDSGCVVAGRPSGKTGYMKRQDFEDLVGSIRRRNAGSLCVSEPLPSVPSDTLFTASKFPIHSTISVASGLSRSK